ncbi:MAG: TolB-like 6-bladed beta-propeller domain-containing protein [Gemmatimonadota bacterium]|nr:TolB-like 6-bladed beta-propeller domain-containing protein [Gemmatimonadota bacterium]
MSKTTPQTFGLLLLAGAGLVATSGALPSDPPRSPAATLRPVAGTAVASQPLYDGAALGLPMRLAVAGDRLIVLDPLAAQAVHVLDARSGALLESFGSRGDGPGEFRGPRSVDVLPGGDAFWVHDLNRQRSTLFSVDPPETTAYRHRETRLLNYEQGIGVFEPIHLGDREILATGMFDKRLGHLDPQGRLIRASGALPPAPDGFSAEEIQFLHQGALQGTPARDRFALASRVFTRVELFDRHGDSQGFVEAPVDLDPEISQKTGFVTSGSPAGYIDLAVTDEAIYALFSGRDPQVFRDEATYAEQVHVFRWNGDFVGAVDLDHDAIAIAVSSDGTELYTLRHYPAIEVRRQELPGPM